MENKINRQSYIQGINKAIQTINLLPVTFPKIQSDEFDAGAKYLKEMAVKELKKIIN